MQKKVMALCLKVQFFFGQPCILTPENELINIFVLRSDCHGTTAQHIQRMSREAARIQRFQYSPAATKYFAASGNNR